MFKKPGIVWLTSALSVCVLIAWAGCTTAPVTGRYQLNLVSDADATQLGLSSFDSLKKSTPISKDARINAMVQKVGQRIASAVGNDLPDAKWEFVVFESQEANAFCLPGGKVGVYTGLLPITQNEDGLATVIGHEVAHATARHGAERMSQELAVKYGGDLLGAGLSAKDPRYGAAFNMAFPTTAKLAVLLPYGRKQESEADRIGLTYMARAGYNPAGAVAFWQRFAAFNKAQGSQNTPSFLRTHPLDDIRIADLQKWQAEAKQAYQPSK